MGLPKNKADATLFYTHLSKDEHCVLEIRFSPPGLAYYTTTLLGSEFDFKPTLYKVQYKDKNTDWGVWHFLGDMPLQSVDMSGNSLIESTWLELP